ncbi:MAG: helix-turn-helix domain-containing protein [Ktedonobacterales bacterium]|nr:helix-turn-helix domain-containing protein [Ktedonobacterales bacterium]
MEQRWLSVAEAARLTRKSPQTIRKWIATGEVTARKEGNRWRVDAGSVIAAAGIVPPMHDSDDLRAQFETLQRLVTEVAAENARLRGLVRQQGADLARIKRRIRLYDDDFTSIVGIARYLERHGFAMATVLKWGKTDRARFPLGQSGTVILTYGLQRRVEAGHRRGDYDPHQCEEARCDCHTYQPPLPPAPNASG